MRLIDADVLKQHIDKLPALPDGNFAGNHSALKALINMQPTIESSTNCSEIQNSSDCISRQAAIESIRECAEAAHSMHDWDMEQGYLNAIECIEEEPSAQPEPLTDKEQRIFLAAMGREEKVCKQVDEECCREPYEDSLVRVCHEIIRKVKAALWET